MKYLVTWHTSADPPRSIYLAQTGAGHWASSFDREKAVTFPTRKAAISSWLGMHRFPDDYRHCLQDGSVRIELVNEPELFTA